MYKERHVRHHSRSYFLSYPRTIGEKLYSIFLWPIVSIVALYFTINYFHIFPKLGPSLTSYDLALATANTLFRLLVAYFFALICAIPLAIFVISKPWIEKIFLPAFDILESVPVLAFFPLLIAVFLQFGFQNSVAIFILFLAMLWNMVFTIVGGIKIIPKDINYAAKIFNISGFRYTKEVLLPAIFPEAITGSILAFAQGWNLIIVAEVIHVYIPNGTSANDLFGLGSILVNASARGDTQLFVITIAIMIFIIALCNYFVWQKLIHNAEKYKFE